MIPKTTLFSLAKTLEGVAVLGVLSGAPAARAGIRYGDILLWVNGVRTRTVTDYVEAKNLRTDGMDIVVFRNGREHAESLVYDERAGPVDTAALLAELVSLRLVPTDDDGAGGRDGERS